MTQAEAINIEYAINKECSRHSLEEFCENYGFTIEDFREFLRLARLSPEVKK